MPSKQAAEVTTRDMTAAEIPSVDGLYRYAAVTAGNHRIRLSRGEQSFERRGGMFVIQNSRSLEGLLHNDDEHIIVADCRGEICGSLWYGNWFEGLFFDLTLFPAYSEYEGFIEKQGRAGKLAYAKEIIVRRPAPVASTAFRLFSHMMDDYAACGFDYVTGRLYRVEYYEDENGRRPCRMMNMPSYRLLTHSGGLHIGQTEPMLIRMDGFNVTVTPQVFLWKTGESADILHRLISNEVHE